MMYDVTEVMRKLEENPTIAMPTDKVRQVKELWIRNNAMLANTVQLFLKIQ